MRLTVINSLSWLLREPSRHWVIFLFLEHAQHRNASHSGNHFTEIHASQCESWPSVSLHHDINSFDRAYRGVKRISAIRCLKIWDPSARHLLICLVQQFKSGRRWKSAGFLGIDLLIVPYCRLSCAKKILCSMTWSMAFDCGHCFGLQIVQSLKILYST